MVLVERRGLGLVDWRPEVSDEGRMCTRSAVVDQLGDDGFHRVGEGEETFHAKAWIAGERW